MHIRRHNLIFGLATLAFALPHPAMAQEIDFGDDTSRYAKDGECDDRRFAGSGMTNTIQIEEDVGHDASDCSAAFEIGSIVYLENQPRPATGDLQWGDDTNEWANDGECDDARFVGSGMTDTLLTDGIGRDATDCRTAYAATTISLNPLFAAADDRLINFGDDRSSFAGNGECDDIRFTGSYASETVYLADDIGHDASDCKMLFKQGDAIWQARDLPFNLGMDADAERSTEQLSD